MLRQSIYKTLFRMVSFGLLLATTLTADESVSPQAMKSTSGEVVTLGAENTNKPTVVAFLGTECPLAKLYAVRLNEMARRFDGKVDFIGIASNRQDSEEELVAYGNKHELSFPLVKDHRNLIADEFGALRTPEVFLLDQSLNIRYRGRVDDQYEPGVSKPKATSHYLGDAISSLLAGQDIAVPKTDAVGCIIGRVKEVDESSDITFANQISRLLNKHCVECHRAGEIGPMSLTDYEEVVGWSDMIIEVVQDGRMPPWHANPEHGEFYNARAMTADEKELLNRWVESGAPFGNPDELPEPVPPVKEWELARAPDLIVDMDKQPFSIPPDGTVDYQYFVVDPGFKEDKWVVGAQIIPGNRSVVHHSIVFVRPPDWVPMDGIGWLTAYVPGQRQLPYPPGVGRLIPAGSKFVFQQHYTPVGTDQQDMTKIGILFGNEPEIHTKLYTLMAVNQDFEIPPNADNHPVKGALQRLPKRGKLLAAAPHMHYRGKSFRLMVERDDSKSEEVMLDVPRYDFNWQHLYVFKKPIELSSISKIRFDARFDNSSSNPFNPDSTIPVFWGDQTWEEMAVVFFEVVEKRNVEAEAKVEDESFVPIHYSEAEKALAKKYKDDFLARFDKNEDGVVHVKSELPYVLRRRSWEFDNNGDGVVGDHELQMVADNIYFHYEESKAESKANSQAEN